MEKTNSSHKDNFFKDSVDLSIDITNEISAIFRKYFAIEKNKKIMENDAFYIIIFSLLVDRFDNPKKFLKYLISNFDNITKDSYRLTFVEKNHLKNTKKLKLFYDYIS